MTLASIRNLKNSALNNDEFAMRENTEQAQYQEKLKEVYNLCSG